MLDRAALVTGAGHGPRASVPGDISVVALSLLGASWVLYAIVGVLKGFVK